MDGKVVFLRTPWAAQAKVSAGPYENIYIPASKSKRIDFCARLSHDVTRNPRTCHASSSSLLWADCLQAPETQRTHAHPHARQLFFPLRGEVAERRPSIPSTQGRHFAGPCRQQPRNAHKAPDHATLHELGARGRQDSAHGTAPGGLRFRNRSASFILMSLKMRAKAREQRHIT